MTRERQSDDNRVAVDLAQHRKPRAQARVPGDQCNQEAEQGHYSHKNY